MITKYEQYLDKISGYLQKFFEIQKYYIFCKEGCAICCETGEYPFSELEFQYAMIGYNALSEKEKGLIQAKIKKIKEAKANSNDKKFMYECPFLIDKKCSIYNYRGIVCRSYGLMYYIADEDDKLFYHMPCCVDNGLNYSNVFDQQTGMISAKKWEQTGIEAEPVSYNLGRKYLLNNNMTQELEIEFGEDRALIDWL